MATTPPPVSSTIHTPPTPLHGAKYDSYQPYSLQRSTRSLTRQLKDSKQSSSSHTFSPPSSAQSSPTATTRKQEEMITTKQSEQTIRVGNTSEEGLGNTSGLLHVDGGTTLAPTAMLPTPAKTPRKRPQQSTHSLRSTARVLFPARDESAEGSMLSPRKRRGGRRVDDSMDGADGEDHQIEIYTDSKDRIPTLDTSEDNPFWDHGKQSEDPSDGLKGGVKRKATVTNEEIEKAVKRRNDGMVYVFRGKKLFLKFDDEDEDTGSGNEDNLNGTNLSPRQTRHFTRSSIKPRLLFPTEEQRREREQSAHEENDDVDEEAITDIDEEALNKKPPSEKTFRNGGTAAELIPPSVSPIEPTTSPLTPTSPSAFTTTRTTRSTTKKEAAAAAEATPKVNNSPLEHEHAIQAPQMPAHSHHRKKKPNSPFNDWRRTKSGIGNSDATAKKGKNKREGDALEKGDEGGVPTTRTTAKRVKLAGGKG